jgi:hypothetical protein
MVFWWNLNETGGHSLEEEMKELEDVFPPAT